MKKISIYNPPCAHYMDLIEDGRFFAFPKRTHGIWDHLSLRIGGLMEAENYKICDQMIFKRPASDDGKDTRHIREDYLKYLDEIMMDIVNPPSQPQYFDSISLSLDYLTKKLHKRQFLCTVRADPRLQAYWQVDYEYSLLFDRLNLWDRKWRYAQTFSGGVVSQEILRLPHLAREYHVVVLGPSKLEDLKLRWNLLDERFTFLPAPAWPALRPNGTVFTDPILPPLTTFRTRYEMLDKLSGIPSTRPKLYLFECGTVSQWLIKRLFVKNPGNTYLDMGRALELWYPDHVWPLKPRIARLYRRAARCYYGPAFDAVAGLRPGGK